MPVAARIFIITAVKSTIKTNWYSTGIALVPINCGSSTTKTPLASQPPAKPTRYAQQVFRPKRSQRTLSPFTTHRSVRHHCPPYKKHSMLATYQVFQVSLRRRCASIRPSALLKSRGIKIMCARMSSPPSPNHPSLRRPNQRRLLNHQLLLCHRTMTMSMRTSSLLQKSPTNVHITAI